MPDTEVSTEVVASRGRVALEEYLVELLGSLVPGLLFLLVLTVTSLPMLVVIYGRLSEAPNPADLGALVQMSGDFIDGTPSFFWLIFLIFAVIIAYVTGHLFYRLPPKRPDQRSFEKVNQKAWERECKSNEELDCNEEPTEDWLRRNFGCTSASDCQFPYPYLRDYLLERGHRHLAQLVPEDFRSKTFINKLKVRLLFFFPNKYRVLIRNEAHVRLATSTWYVSRQVQEFTKLWLACSAIAVFLVEALMPSPGLEQLVAWYWVPFLTPGISLLAASRARRTLEEFIHYQRLREVFWVLETAFVAFNDSMPDMLEVEGSERWRARRDLSPG